MDWIKIFMCLCLATSNAISSKPDNPDKKVNAPHEDAIHLNNRQNLESNTTHNTGEILDKSPSEIITVKKLRETDSSVNDYEKGPIKRSDDNKERNSAKDLTAQENRYGPVVAFTETPKSHEKIWKIIPHAPPYREQQEFRTSIPITESQSFVNKPKMSSAQINYSPSMNPEGRNNDDSRSREYYHDYDSHGQRYADPGHGHAVHTETTHDYGRFLPVHYKSQIEKDAEELVKRQRSQNGTKTDRPQSNQQQHRQKPRGYSHAHRQPGSKVFFHLGHSEAPNSHKYPTALHNQGDQRYQYTSEEYPRTEQYPTRHYTLDSRKRIPPSTIRDSYNARQPISSTEAYQPDYSYPAEQYPSHHPVGPPNAPRHYDSSTERYPPVYSDSLQKDAPIYSGITTHSPRLYSTSAEQSPHHYQNNEKKFLAPYAADFNSPTDHINPPQTTYTPKQYSTSAELPPNYQGDGKALLSPYAAGFNSPVDHINSPQKEFQGPYSDDPRAHAAPSPDNPHFNKQSVSAVPQSNQSPAKPTDGAHGEKTYFNTYTSLLDLYRSFGFQPLNLNEMPEIYPPRFSYGSLNGKISITTPLSGSLSTENYASNSKFPAYVANSNANSPVVQNYNGYQTPYAIAPHNDKTTEYGTSHFKPNIEQTNPHPIPLKNYHEQVPFDSNRSPVVSTEHYDNSEIPRPDVYNTQVESPKETFPQDEFHNKFYSDLKSTEYEPPQGRRIKPIRIKDYNAETFYGDPSQKNAENSAESDISLTSQHDSPPPSHPIVRKNPYHLESPHSGEVRATNRPRIYKENVNLENIPPASNSEEMNNFQHNEKPTQFGSPNIIDTYNDVRPMDSSFTDTSDNQQNEYNLPNSQTTPPETKNYQQWKSNSPNKPTYQDDPQHYKNNKRKRPVPSSDKIYQEESMYGGQEQRSGRAANSNTRSKRKGRRSSHRGSKKQKTSARSQGGDNLRAEGSTYHWGMERHKDTDGFFQYANVPGVKAFEFGYRMGGPEHTRERHHRTKGIQSKIKENWEHENGDTGDHYWEFNHDSREDDADERRPKKQRSNTSDE